ncbi:MAG: ABC-2 family transporter protein [Armatimonadetes bacterium]|nr:ABC-2 family transporter protein [Armatimonadota bacterium]
MSRWVKTLVSTQMQISMAHKVAFFFSMFISVFPLLAKVVLWKAIYNTQPAGTTIGGFDVRNMVTYYLIFQVIFEITYCEIDIYRIVPHIVQGELTQCLLRPISYLCYVSFEYFSYLFLPRFLSVFVIYIPVALIFTSDVALHVSLAAFGIGVVSLVISCVFNYAYHICTGLAAFWLEDRPPFSGLLVAFMGGFIIPIDLMPSWMQRLSAFLPFQYAIYLPVKIFMGKLSLAQAVPGLAIQAGWVLAFMLIAKMLWRSGIRKYQAYGG